MAEELAKALDQSSHTVARALESARAELAQLEARRSTLLELIARAEAVQRSHAPQAGSRVTLHQAMATVLREHGNRWMNIRELGNEVNLRGLYRKRNGSEVDINQFHARINSYRGLFERDGPNVRLRE